jgi:DNA-binding PadR family transcriptional regulator
MYILVALAEAPSHGYRIMSEVEALSGGVMRLGPGTLYGSIKRMLGQGLIEELEQRPDPDLDDERRRYYQLTALGTRVATAELDRLTTLARTAEKRFAARPQLGLS